MPRYWRDPDDDTVHLLKARQYLSGTGEVLVIPLEKWRRLVELCQSWMPSCLCDGHCESCEEDREIADIIASVGVNHD